MTFSVTILGSSSARPTVHKHPAAHALNVHEQFYLIDCGEGTQRRLLQCGIHPMKINAVFLTHLHGDHCYGIFPLISTLGLMGRRLPLQVFAPEPFGEMLENHFRYFDTQLPFRVDFKKVDTRAHRMIYENKVMEVWSIPLRHRIACAGYHFREKTPPRNIYKEAVQRYGLGIAQIAAAKRGEDLTLDDGSPLPNGTITYQPYVPRSYAYLSDTQYSARAAGLIKGVDLLYHEATFMDAERALARQTGHSTTLQAAKVATLAQATELLIGHTSARYEDDKVLEAETRTVFARTSLAREGTTYTIPLQKHEKGC